MTRSVIGESRTSQLGLKPDTELVEVSLEEYSHITSTTLTVIAGKNRDSPIFPDGTVTLKVRYDHVEMLLRHYTARYC